MHGEKFVTVRGEQPSKPRRHSGSVSKANLTGEAEIIPATPESAFKGSIFEGYGINLLAVYLVKNCKNPGQDSLILKAVPT